jgi:TusA-related sulfurtransferase
MNSTPANGYLIDNDTDTCIAQYCTVGAIKKAIANIKPGQRIEVQSYADVTEIVAEA